MDSICYFTLDRKLLYTSFLLGYLSTCLKMLQIFQSEIVFFLIYLSISIAEKNSEKFYLFKSLV